MPEPKHAAKAAMIDLIHRLPDDSSWDDLLREIAFAGRIERGLADLENDDLVSYERLRAKVERWHR